MATERINVIVTSKGTVVVRRELEDIGSSAKKSIVGVDALKTALGALSVGFLASEFIKYSDSALRLTNSLKLAGLQGEAFAETQGRIYDAAINNGQVAEDLGVIYRKMVETQDQLGISQEQVITTTEGIASAMRLSTAGTAAQQGALQQLGQLLGGVMVQAQEYNSLIDGAYPLLQAVADGSDRWAGSVARLTQDVKASSVTVTEFVAALQTGLAETQRLAESMPLTIGQSFASLDQAFTAWIATSSEASIAAGLLADAVQFLAANMDTVAPAVVLLGTAIGVYLAGSIIASAISSAIALTAAMVRLAAVVGAQAVGAFASAASAIMTVTRAFVALAFAMAANPFTIVIAGAIAFGAAVLALTGYFDEVWAYIVEWANWVAEKFGWLKDQFNEWFGDLKGGKLDVEVQADQLRAAAKDFEKALSGAGSGAGEAVAKPLEKTLKSGGEELRKGVEKGANTGATALEKANSGAAEKMGETFDKAAAQQTNINDVFVAKFAGTGRNIYDLWNNWGNSFIDSFGTTIGSLLIQYQRAQTDALKAQAELYRQQAYNMELQNEYIKRKGTTIPEGSNSRDDSADSSRTKMSTTTATGLRFAKGGEFRVGGSGGTDSQLVRLRATPNETVRVMTPEQRAREQQAAQQPQTPAAPQQPTQVINLFDPAAILAALQTAEGRDTMINVVKANRDEFAELLGVV